MYERTWLLATRGATLLSVGRTVVACRTEFDSQPLHTAVGNLCKHTIRIRRMRTIHTQQTTHSRNYNLEQTSRVGKASTQASIPNPWYPRTSDRVRIRTWASKLEACMERHNHHISYPQVNVSLNIITTTRRLSTYPAAMQQETGRRGTPLPPPIHPMIQARNTFI